jgi:hypothetical protein
MILKNESTNYFFALIQEQDILSERRMWLKIGMLGIGIKYKQLDDALSAIGSNIVCHRKAHAFFTRCFLY